jgi:hypothetical protein
MGGFKSSYMDCLQQSKTFVPNHIRNILTQVSPVCGLLLCDLQTEFEPAEQQTG